MKKILVVSLIALSANLYAINTNRRIELLENAVVKLINENSALKAELTKKNEELNQLKNKEELNNEAIFNLENKIKNLKSKNYTFYARVNSFGLNVREKPTTKSKVTDRLKKGDLVKIYKTELNNGTVWYKIKNGYISSNFTSMVYGDGLKKDKIKAPVLSFTLPKKIKTINPVKNTNKTKTILISKKRPPEYNNTNNQKEINLTKEK